MDARFANPSHRERDVLAALAAERGIAPPVPAQLTAGRPAVSFPPLRDGDIHLGDADAGGPIGFDVSKLIEGRLLVQGASSAGKSWTLRRLLEQTARTVQQVIIDPEGEFRSLVDVFGHIHLEGHLLDAATLAIAARRAREHRLSIILDLSQMERDDQMIAATAFIGALIDCPREHWHSAIVAIDEAHLFAPAATQSTTAASVRKAAVGVVTDLMSRGRKRGLAGVLATQRLARLAKSVVSEANNFLIGLNTLDLDIRRAAETIGWDARRAFDRLPMLSAGEFVAVGPAFSRSPAVIKVGPVQTHHRGATPELLAPADMDREEAKKLLNLDELVGASAADAALLDEANLPQGFKAVRGFLRDEASADAARIWKELVPLYPDGAAVSAIGEHLSLSIEATGAAIALLDSYGVLEFMGDSAERVVRASRGMM